MRDHPRGAALIDLVFTCGLVAVLAAMALPSLHAMRERDATRVAARLLASRLQALRVEAVRRNRVVALRVDSRESGLFSSYADGDGDGISERDIDRGVDPAIEASWRLADLSRGVSLRIAHSIPAPDHTGTLAAGSDPVRIGSTRLLSFSPLGSATSGTVYLAGEGGTQVCVRIFGATGRVRVLWFDPASRSWRQD